MIKRIKIKFFENEFKTKKIYLKFFKFKIIEKIWIIKIMNSIKYIKK